MNIIDEEFQPTTKKNDPKKMKKIILIVIILLVIAMIAVMITIAYMKDKQLKVYVDGVQNDKVKSMMLIDSDGTIYFPIREIAQYLGYASYSGTYADRSESKNQCYVQDMPNGLRSQNAQSNEIANFTFNSNKIEKLRLSGDGNYQYYYANKPVKSQDGVLYASSDAIENAFNVSFTYNSENQRAYFYTMPYLIQSYTTSVTDYGYSKIDNDFDNQKAVLNSMLVVVDSRNNYAVIDLKGNPILEAKYGGIQYLPYSGDFLVKSNNKVGIMSAKKETKVQIIYESLNLISAESNLYVARRNGKYGVIDSNGNIKIYIQYDQIGIDNISSYKENNIQNKYLLDNGMIPAKKDGLWGAFDKDGKQVLQFEYEKFGYSGQSSNNYLSLLIIPKYNDMVVYKNKKYGLVDSYGNPVILCVLDDVYMTIDDGNKNYWTSYNDKRYDLINDILIKLGPVQGSDDEENDDHDDKELTNAINNDNDEESNTESLNETIEELRNAAAANAVNDTDDDDDE